MVRNKKSLGIISVFLIILYGCSSGDYTNPNQTLNNIKETFCIETNISGFLDHFPKKIKNRNIFFEVSYPSCPPTYKCLAQFGDVYLNVNKTDYKNELKKLLNREVLYLTNYIDSNNIIINLTGLRNKFFLLKRCNKYYSDKLPIPYFEAYDFGLGVKEEKKEVNGEFHFNYIHTVPDDLTVYVIAARAGNFWKFDCKETRPETLGKWKHGYSKGVAVSDKYNRVVFWVIVW